MHDQACGKAKQESVSLYLRCRVYTRIEPTCCSRSSPVRSTSTAPSFISRRASFLTRFSPRSSSDRRLSGSGSNSWSGWFRSNITHAQSLRAECPHRSGRGPCWFSTSWNEPWKCGRNDTTRPVLADEARHAASSTPCGTGRLCLGSRVASGFPRLGILSQEAELRLDDEVALSQRKLHR